MVFDESQAAARAGAGETTGWCPPPASEERQTTSARAAACERGEDEMEIKSDRTRTLFGSHLATSHEARRRSVATDVQPFSPAESHVRLVRHAGLPGFASGERIARPESESTAGTVPGWFDFNAIPDATLLGWLNAQGRRPNVLVECPRGSADTVVRHLMTWCALPFRFSPLPGTLELPTIRRGTLLLKDVAALTLSQQVMLYDWLTAGCGNMQVVSVASAPLQMLAEDGEFLEGLLYRLNIIRLDAGRGTRPAPLSAWRDSHEALV
jgi:hypothetical protein